MFNRIPLKRVKGLVFLWVVIFVVGGWSLSTNYQTQLRNRDDLARQQHEISCDKEFRTVLIESRANNTEIFNLVMQFAKNDKEWRDAINHPPSELYGRFDQERADWLIRISNEAGARTDALISDMMKALAKRNSNPYPDISCGRT